MAWAISKWVEPEENPSGVVYGTIAVGAVIAAESTRTQTFTDTFEATVLILALYWLAHTFATVVGHRFETRKSLSSGGLWRAFPHEGAIVKGAAIPIAVLVVLWMASIALDTAALWTSAVLLAAFEIVATFRSHVSGAQRLAQVLLGVLLGAGVLLVHLVLH